MVIFHSKLLVYQAGYQLYQFYPPRIDARNARNWVPFRIDFPRPHLEEVLDVCLARSLSESMVEGRVRSVRS